MVPQQYTQRHMNLNVLYINEMTYLRRLMQSNYQRETKSQQVSYAHFCCIGI